LKRRRDRNTVTLVRQVTACYILQSVQSSARNITGLLKRCQFLQAYLRTKWYPDASRHGPKIGGCAPLFEAGAGSPSNTKSPGPRPTFIPSGILIHPAVWSQLTWAENCGVVPLFFCGGLGPHVTQCGLGRGLPPCQVSF